MIRVPLTAVFAVALCFSLSQSCPAELIQLDSGETIQAEILKISAKHLQLRHAILGDIEIPRDRVHSIIMGDPKDGIIIKPDGSKAEPETPGEVIDRMVNKDFGPDAVKKLEKGAKRQSTPQDAIDQLRREGVDTQLTDRLHLMLPGFGAPEVQNYFNGSVEGLISGSLSLQDIRNDAIDARDQLHVLMEDLGPDAAALKGYYGILDHFIRKTAPASDSRPRPNSPKPNTPSPATPKSR